MNEQTQHIDKEPTPYGDIAYEMYDNGYAPVPLVRGEKYPALDDWQLRAGDTLRSYQIEAEVERYAGNNVGVVLGKDLLAIDVDTDNPERIEAIKQMCQRRGWWAAVRFGSKGFALFLRVVTPFQMKGQDDWSVVQLFDQVHLCPQLAIGKQAKAAVEIFHGPKQVVLPPSIHPDTGLAFRWMTTTPLHEIHIDDLPEVTGAALNAFVKELAEIGIGLDRPRPARPAGGPVATQTRPRASEAPAGALAAYAARRASGVPRRGDYELQPHAIAYWLDMVERVGIPMITSETWQPAPLDYLPPRTPGNRSDVWKFVSTWRATGLSDEKLRKGATRGRACSIKPWDIVNDPDAKLAGIRDHGNAVEFGDNAFDAFSFIVRLLTPPGISTDWISHETAKPWRRWIMQTLRESVPEFEAAEDAYFADVGFFGGQVPSPEART